MISISNADVAEVRRLLGELRRLEGEDAKTKNIKRRANLLQKKLGAKKPEQ